MEPPRQTKWQILSQIIESTNFNEGEITLPLVETSVVVDCSQVPSQAMVFVRMLDTVSSALVVPVASSRVDVSVSSPLPVSLGRPTTAVMVSASHAVTAVGSVVRAAKVVEVVSSVPRPGPTVRMTQVTMMSQWEFYASNANRRLVLRLSVWPTWKTLVTMGLWRNRLSPVVHRVSDAFGMITRALSKKIVVSSPKLKLVVNVWRIVMQRWRAFVFSFVAFVTKWTSFTPHEVVNVSSYLSFLV